jgi:two-component system OmpR family response regulator
LKHSPHILIVDDDSDIRDLLCGFLRKRGFRINVAEDGTQMTAVLRETAIDLIILDIMLPGQNGLELCQEIRTRSRTPIIMLTAIAETADRIVGLEVGADDYIAKPFDPHELLARIKAVLRRHENPHAAQPIQDVPRLYHFAGWMLDVDRRRLVDPKGVRVELTQAEFNLLKILVGSKQRVLSRQQLSDFAGGDMESFDRSVDILVSRLRRKLYDNPRDPGMILTVRGGGYQFVAEATVE